MVKLLFKLIWLGFGTFGLVTVGQKYWPQFKPVKQVVSALPQTNVETLKPVLQEQLVKIMGAASEQIKSFPATQVKKIKIGACEELLEEDKLLRQHLPLEIHLQYLYYSQILYLKECFFEQSCLRLA